MLISDACIGLIVIAVLSVYVVASDDILGCGGFIKSDVEINFSLVEVKLYTTQGSLKYQVDCAPNNGYYMIPVYDKGDYVLKVEPPKGWNFEPSSVDLHIDGKTDACSRGDDINFHFIGFSVEGRVTSRGTEAGPAGVPLKLVDKKGRLATQESSTSDSGTFRFDRVLPGNYDVIASHPSWKFDKSTVVVKVDKSNVKSLTGIVVHGYDVSGRVLSEGDPVSGVHFLFFSDKVKPSDIVGCDKIIPSGYSSQLKPVCSVQSGKDGLFRLQTLPSGTYSVVPFYKAEKLTFDVRPARLEFTVSHGSLVLNDFHVAGFSVSGRVLNKAKGSGVADAEISVDNVLTTKTRGDGTYVLDNMKTGTFVISVKAREMGFEPTTVKVSPNTPNLPDITPTSFSLCGAIIIDKLPRSMTETSLVREVKVIEEKSKAETNVKSDEEGKFCAQVKAGSYIVKPILSREELSSGLKLSRDQQKVTVTDAPVHGVTFSQFKASAAGKVTCIGKCPALLHISLVAAGVSGDHRTTKLDAKQSQAEFSFKDLMPGRYQVQLVEEERCWREKSIQFELVDKDVTSLTFVQTGFVLTYTSTHDVTLETSSSGKVRSLDVKKGSGSHCLPEAGRYTLVPKSCHRFQHDSYSFDTSSPRPLIITAVKHQIGVTVRSSENVTDLKLDIRSTKPDSVADTYVVTSVLDKNVYKYQITHWADAGEEMAIVPSSKTLLFHPPTKTVIVNSDSCPGVKAEFEGRKGVFISGHVTPALDDVTVTVTSDQDAGLVINVKTDASGKYSVGPLHDNLKYEVRAEKEGYVLTAKKDKPNSFNAFKLGQINVKVVDTSGQALGGVLLSVSGGEKYRSNKLTLDDGTMNFIGLSPGQYFMRPMMKEYEFEPSTKMMEVQEGSTVTVDVKGKRVAYSCYGSVTSLNGEPESGVVVEAVGVKECSQYQEESKTEKDGSYRIRGLKPKCEYEVRLKQGEVNEHVDRAAPDSIPVKVANGDVSKMDIIAFRRMNQMDLSGRMVAQQEHLNTLKVLIYRESNPDEALHSVRLSVSNMFYLPSIPMDNQNYILRVKTTLPRSQYDYTLQELTFKANSSHQHFQLAFTPKRRNTDQEVSHSSFLIVPLTLLVLFLSYHSEQVKPFLLSVAGTVTGRRAPATSSPSRSPARSPSPQEASLAPAGDVLIKKKMKARRT